jgi:hypothetical protein
MWLTKYPFQPADTVNPPAEYFLFSFSLFLEENEKKKKNLFLSPAIFSSEKIA